MAIPAATLAAAAPQGIADLARGYLEAVGGTGNLENIDACITRLRLSVNDMSKVDSAALKANRAIGVVQLNQHNLQVVIGPQVQSVKDEMAVLMNTVEA